MLLQLAADRVEELKKQAEKSGPGIKPKKANSQPLKVMRQGVGTYLTLQSDSPSNKTQKTDEVPAKKSKKDGPYRFGAFDSW